MGSASFVTLGEARDRALEYRRMARQGINPRFQKSQSIPTFEEIAKQAHLERMPKWKNQKHGQQWINTLRDYAFPKIGRMPVDAVGTAEVLMCLSPVWTEKHETARRLSQRMKVVLDVAKAKGFRTGENPVTEIKDAGVLPTVTSQPIHHKAMAWREVPALYARLSTRTAIAAKALQMTCLTALRTGEVLGATWDEFNLEAEIWTIPAARMKTGLEHRVPLVPETLALLEPLRELKSDVVFEGQKRHQPLSNMSMLMLLRRMGVEGVTVHGFRSSFRDWAAEVAMAPREVAELCLAHKVGSDVERAYARSDLLDHRRKLMAEWAWYVANHVSSAEGTLDARKG